jgi:hypothetical protein
MFDQSYSNDKINLVQTQITHRNVLNVFKKYSITSPIGILSVDTDYADYWILETILSEYKSNMVIHEVNQQPPEKCVTVPKSDLVLNWNAGTDYHGGSVCAFYCLAKNNNYTMIYCESKGVNCFWIRNEILEGYLDLKATYVQHILTPHYLFRNASFTYTRTNNPWTIIQCE